MKHPVEVEGYGDNRFVICNVQGLDMMRRRAFFYFLAKALRSASIKDAERGRNKLAKKGMEASELLGKMHGDYLFEDVERSGLIDDLAMKVERLRYDAMSNLVRSMGETFGDDFEGDNVLEPVADIIWEMWKISEPFAKED